MVGSGIQSTVAPDASSPEVSTGRRGGRGSTSVDSTPIVEGNLKRLIEKVLGLLIL